MLLKGLRHSRQCLRLPKLSTSIIIDVKPDRMLWKALTHVPSMQVSSFRKLRRVGSDSAQLFGMAASLSGTLQLGSDEEEDLADDSGFTTQGASAASMRNGVSHWVEGAPRGTRGRAKGAHLRVTLPAGSTKVRGEPRHFLTSVVMFI